MKTILTIDEPGELQFSVNGRVVGSVIVTAGAVVFLQQPEVWKRCDRCNGTGRLFGAPYCTCSLGRDLARVEQRGFQAPELGDEG